MLTPNRTFASDNNSGVSPEILKSIETINQGHLPAYGDDPVTFQAVEKFKEHFGKNIEVFFVFNGTAANVLSLKTLTQPYNGVVCAEFAHINHDECGAPERFTGCKLLGIPTEDGKLTPDMVSKRIANLTTPHQVAPKAISITQSTEMGTVYSPEEIRALADYAHSRGMYLHMDGARISNAAAGLDLPLKAITADVGLDVLSFGGTKNGLLFGEAIVFFKKELAENFKFIRKQAMQLASKHRFVAIQFHTLLSNNLWLKNASHANRMAQALATEIKKIPQLKITQKVQANGVFVTIPAQYVKRLQEKVPFYIWVERISEARLMMSFDTQKEDIENFVGLVNRVIADTPTKSGI
jgi:threonine aldolase